MNYTKRNILNKSLVSGTRIQGLINENSLILEIVDDVHSIDSIEAFRKMRVKVLLTGKGKHELFYEQFNNQKEVIIDDIISFAGEFDLDITPYFDPKYFSIVDDESESSYKLFDQFSKAIEELLSFKLAMYPILKITIKVLILLFANDRYDSLNAFNRNDLIMSSNDNYLHLNELLDFIKQRSSNLRVQHLINIIYKKYADTNLIYRPLGPVYIWSAFLENLVFNLDIGRKSFWNNVSNRVFEDIFKANRFSQLSNSPLVNFVLSSFIKKDEMNHGVFDPACGIGNTLIQIAKDHNLSKEGIKGNDINETAHFLTYLNFLLEDFDINKVSNEDFLSTDKEENHSLIVSVLPYGRTRDKRLKKRNFIELFIDKIFQQNANPFKAFLIVSDGFLFSNSTTKDYLIEQKCIKAIIQLPNIEIRHSVNQSLLILDTSKRYDSVLMVNAKDFDIKSHVINKDYIDFQHEILKMSEVYFEHNVEGSLDFITYSEVSLDEILRTQSNLTPNRYVFTGPEEKFKSYLSHEDTIPLSRIFENVVRGRRIRINRDAELIPAKKITTKELRKSTNQQFNGNSINEKIPVNVNHLVGEIDILLPMTDFKLAKIYNPNNWKQFVLDPNVLGIKIDRSKILPEYIIHQFQQSIFDFQFRLFTNGTTIPRINPRQFNEILIKVPSIEEQIRLLNLDHKKTGQDDNNVIETDDQITISRALKHYIGNQSLLINTNINYLKTKLSKVFEATSYSWTDPVDENYDRSLLDCFSSVEGYIADIKEINLKMNNLLELDRELTMEKKPIIPLLKNISSKYKNGFEVSVTGVSRLIELSEFGLNILIENLFSNFVKHGLKDNIKEPKVEFEVIGERNSLAILYKNNGSPFDNSFSFEDFLKADSTAGNTAGTGLGGALIKKVIDKCGYQLEPITLHGDYDSEWNVVLRINLNRQ